MSLGKVMAGSNAVSLKNRISSIVSDVGAMHFCDIQPNGMIRL